MKPTISCVIVTAILLSALLACPLSTRGAPRPEAEAEAEAASSVQAVPASGAAGGVSTPEGVDAGFDTWAAYRSRWNAIQTVTVYTTDSVEMLRAVDDPLEAPRAIILEGKIDRQHLRAKANLLLDFGPVQSGVQMKASADSPHTIQRPVMIVQNQWIPLERDHPTTTTEQPETLLLDMLFLPDPNGEWARVEGVEDEILDVEGLGAIPVTFVNYRRSDGRMEISISVDGRAVGGMRVFDKSGRPRTSGRVLLWTRQNPIGYVPRAVVFRQFDEEGRPYRDLRGLIVARLNEPGFDYLFD